MQTSNEVKAIESTVTDWAITPPAGIRRLEVDHMPIPVATEMLCAPKARLTNRERKECRRARENHYVPTRIKQPIEDKLARHVRESNVFQLARDSRRAVSRRRDAQCQFQMLGRQLEKLGAVADQKNPVVQYARTVSLRRQAQLEIVANHYDTISDLITAELKARHNGQS